MNTSIFLAEVRMVKISKTKTNSIDVIHPVYSPCCLKDYKIILNVKGRVNWEKQELTAMFSVKYR